MPPCASPSRCGNIPPATAGQWSFSVVPDAEEAGPTSRRPPGRGVLRDRPVRLTTALALPLSRRRLPLGIRRARLPCPPRPHSRTSARLRLSPPPRQRYVRLPPLSSACPDKGADREVPAASHRTTAAVIVLWLERLRADPGLRPILTVERGEEL
ncbi:hypothetical protein GCM10009654_53540 [Streptomyces hebeiensis]|uniref:Uncharacterized protein n=1 Tax=Streptomyces hebeiensis TaxID=229486 RepID=A0ABP4FL08_9ACTN